MPRWYSTLKLSLILYHLSYKILNPAACVKESDEKKCAGAILESTGLDADLYRLGHTKACPPLDSFSLCCSFSITMLDATDIVPNCLEEQRFIPQCI